MAQLLMTMSTKIRRYSELRRLKTFEERFEYLRLNGTVGYDTFGFDRYLNQNFYKSELWKRARRDVIVRDLGRDLGIEGRELEGNIQIHHMNPITKEDILENSDFLLNPEFLICTSGRTHKAIHYGDKELLVRDPIVRSPFDTCPWRKHTEGDHDDRNHYESKDENLF